MADTCQPDGPNRRSTIAPPPRQGRVGSATLSGIGVDASSSQRPFIADPNTAASATASTDPAA